MAQICLVSCVRTKLESGAAASDLYTSPLFRKAKELACKRFDRWYILSAKYGLVRPDEIIEPYELTLNQMPQSERREWASSVMDRLAPELSPGDEITFLAGERYNDELSRLLRERGFSVKTPLQGMGIGKQLRWLTQQLRGSSRVEHLNRFYDLLQILRSGLAGGRVLAKCSGSDAWPKRGVYFFFEPGELRTASSLERVVRVGTHAVSRGSQSTLWGRLRTHLGTDAGTGNHRGSVFRLHVGAALIARSKGNLNVPSWACGQNARADVRASEEFLEREVSAYIGRMSILWLAVDDKSSPASDRAYIERNSIGLLCGPTGPIDSPSADWLGNFSAHEAIRTSGLWNVDHVDYRYDPRFLGIFEQFVEITLGKRKQPNRCLAPRDWHAADRKRTARGQLSLFREDA